MTADHPVDFLYYSLSRFLISAYLLLFYCINSIVALSEFIIKSVMTLQSIIWTLDYIGIKLRLALPSVIIALLF